MRTNIYGALAWLSDIEFITDNNLAYVQPAVIQEKQHVFSAKGSFTMQLEFGMLMHYLHICSIFGYLGTLSITLTQVNSVYHPSGVGLVGVKAGRVHLCRVAGNTV